MYDIRDFFKKRSSEPSKERLPLLFGYFVIFGGTLVVSVTLTLLIVSGIMEASKDKPPQKSYTEERLEQCSSECHKLGMLVGLFSTRNTGNDCYCKFKKSED